MALEIRLAQKLSQSLLMTPQLQQAIKLLQLGRLEYKEAIEKELLENPVLEELKSDEPDQPKAGSDSPQPEPEKNPADEPESDAHVALNKDGSPLAWEDYVADYSDYRESSTPKGFIDYEDRPSLEATLTKGRDLNQHLLEQLRMADCLPEERAAAAHVIGNLNKDGYLCASDEELAAESGCDLELIRRAVELVQSFDPPGVAARNLSECLLIQLANRGQDESLAARICRRHLDKIERRKYEQTAKEEGVSLEDVYQAVHLIQSLEPRPGRAFADEAARYIVPDIYVYKDSGEYVIVLNEEGLPRLRVNPYYLRLLQDNGGKDAPDRAYLTERLKAASWLIKSIHQRQQTIYKVTASIVKFQREFLEKGIDYLRPLTLKEVAADIGMHESTVSRVTNNKYVHTPQGVYELKFFFTTAIKTGEGEVSSSAVKQRIRSLIMEEPPDNPLSDQRIVEILKAEGVDIARRTVAKYRESMKILPSSQRRKPF